MLRCAAFKRRIGAVELRSVGRLEQDHLVLDAAHADLGKRRSLVPLRSLFGPQLASELLAVLLSG